MALLPGRPKSCETFECWQLINFRNPNSKFKPELNNAVLQYIHSEAVDFADHLLHFETSLTSDGCFARKCEDIFVVKPWRTNILVRTCRLSFRFCHQLAWNINKLHLDPGIDRVGPYDRSTSIADRLDRSTRLLTYPSTRLDSSNQRSTRSIDSTFHQSFEFLNRFNDCFETL